LAFEPLIFKGLAGAAREDRTLALGTSTIEKTRLFEAAYASMCTTDVSRRQVFALMKALSKTETPPTGRAFLG
jgi:hypothetical protein